MAEYELKNDTVQVGFQAHGAEVISLKKKGTEYVWCGDPAYWGRHAPVLFPFVGQVWNKQYRFQGKTYAMGQHGFARDMDFTLKEQTADSIAFVLRENEETLAKYPFRFELEIRYTLGQSPDRLAADSGLTDALTVTWTVRNPGSQLLYFSIGGHPAFLCPLAGRGGWEDYRIALFKDGQPLTQIKLRPIVSGGCFGDELTSMALPYGMLTPSDELFSQDALVLENQQADRAALIGPDGRPYLSLASDAPCLGIWSPVGKHAPFICLEPWYGRADRAGFTGDLSQREYGNVLQPGEVFQKSFVVTL